MADAVFCIEPPGIEDAVHEFREGDYGLSDVPELMLVGRTVADPEGRERISLTAHEIRELRTFADAYSFDFDAGLIALCLDLHDFASARPEREFTFVATS